jgi:hypothetical protein
MSTLTYAHSTAIGTDAKTAEAGAAPNRSFWGRVFDALVAAQQRRAEREIALFLRTRGGLFNDATEREIMERLSGKRRSV